MISFRTHFWGRGRRRRRREKKLTQQDLAAVPAARGSDVVATQPLPDLVAFALEDHALLLPRPLALVTMWGVGSEDHGAVGPLEGHLLAGHAHARFQVDLAADLAVRAVALVGDPAGRGVLGCVLDVRPLAKVLARVLHVAVSQLECAEGGGRSRHGEGDEGGDVHVVVVCFSFCLSCVSVFYWAAMSRQTDAGMCCWSCEGCLA